MPAKENKVMAFFREELRAAHQLLEGTMEGVTVDQAHWAPPGIALSIGATYARIVLSEDATINGIFKGAAPFSPAHGPGGPGPATSLPRPIPTLPVFRTGADGGGGSK